MNLLRTRDLVDAGLYESESAVIQDALRLLFQEKPQVRIALAIHRYQTEEISLARAASLAGVSFDRMKDVLVSRGVQLRLGPETPEEAMEEVEAMRRIVREDAG